MISTFLSSTLPTSVTATDFCSAAVEYFIKKFKVVDLMCGIGSKTGLLQKFCSTIIDSSGIVSETLHALCGFAVTVIKEVLGMDLNSFYTSIQNDVNFLLNKTSKSVCGMLLCSSTSGGCTEEKYSSGVVAKIADKATQLYCFGEKVGNLILIWVVTILIFFE